MAEGSSVATAPSVRSLPETADVRSVGETNYRILAEHISDIIVRADTTGAILCISQACRALGYEPEELIGRSPAELVHPDDFPRFAANVAAVFSGEPVDRTVDREIRYRRKDGSWAWLEGNPRLIRDAFGRPAELLNVFRDITERKLAQIAAREADAERRANAQLFENAFLHAAIGMALVGLDGRFLKVNPAFCDLMGHGQQRMLTLDFQAITHPDDLAADLGLLGRLTTGQIPSYQMDKRYIRADGAVVWARLSVSMVTEPDGQPKHFIAQVQDQTAHRAAECALAQSELRFRRLADNAPDMIAESTLEGVMTYVSPACLATTGFTPEELIGRTFISLMHPEDGQAVLTMCQTVFASKGDVAPWPVEFRAEHKDGRPLWMECKPTLARDSETGLFTGLTDVIRDITTRKQLEADLRRTQTDAEAAAAVKGEFLANMSHEIRTSLTAILGFSGLLAERQGLDEVGRGHLQRVVTASQSLLSIVNDILNFSKLEAGCIDLAPRPVAPVEFTGDALNMFAPQADAKGLSLAFEVEGEPPAYVALDPDKVRQILFNLIGNAIKFTAAGGVRLRLGYDLASAKLRVAIEDTGPGIAETDQSKLFQRFAQVDGSSTRRHGGTGLGLAICRGLVETMGGRICVGSTIGKGSIFSFDISAPIAEAPPSAEESEDACAPLDGVRVLVIDDNAVNRELARAVLESAGADVTLAEDGEAGAARAAAWPFDVILLDRRMPGLDGPETLRRIRSAPGPNDAIPILAFSADVDLARLIGPGGFDDAIGKPVNPREMIQTVSRWTEWSEPGPGTKTADAAHA